MELWSDIRFGSRLLLRSPGWTAAIGATLALGVGMSTAIFSVVHAALLRDLPFGPRRIRSAGTRGQASAPGRTRLRNP
jgi:hypothetical protein